MTELNELAQALNEFQAELVIVGKGKTNPFFKAKYADLASIMLEAQPILTKHGLAISQLPDNIDGRPALTTILMHKSGQHISAVVPLILTKEDPQAVGSAITYMRRYGYAAVLQIVIDEDDDGNRARAAVEKAGGATQAQKDAINRHLEKIGIESAERANYLTATYGVTHPLTKGAAATIIDKIILENSK
jgi:ERF superfamily